MRRALVLVLLTGCAPFTVDADVRCAEVNTKMHECLGEGFPDLTCTGMSDADLDAIDELIEDSECSYWRDAIPQDGDLQASYCRLYDDGCAAARNPRPSRTPTQYPVVFVNGIDVSFAFRYSERIFRVVRELGGHDAHFAIVPPYEATARRSRVLWTKVQQIREETGAPKVNLICHSLGGLDCRYLVSPGGLHWEVEASHAEIAGSVASVTTVATAHRGTRVADAALGYLPGTDATEALASMATFVGDWFSDANLEEDADLRASLAALSESQALAFNVDVPNADGIYYQSWSGFSRPFGEASAAHDELLFTECVNDDGVLNVGSYTDQHDYLAMTLLPSYEIVGRADDDDPDALIPNDGLCTVRSAKWGRFRGCVPVDHMEQLGQLNLPDANVKNGFDIAWFYANVAGELAGMGF